MNGLGFLELQDGRGAESEPSEDHSCPGNRRCAAEVLIQIHTGPSQETHSQIPLHLNIQKNQNVREEDHSSFSCCLLEQ